MVSTYGTPQVARVDLVSVSYSRLTAIIHYARQNLFMALIEKFVGPDRSYWSTNVRYPFRSVYYRRPVSDLSER